jgi:uncharacterized protein (DUF2384 family)
MRTFDPEQIERDSTIAPVRELAHYLQETVGQKMTAFLAGLNDPRVVGRWASGKNAPQLENEMRLRYGYRVVRLLTNAYDPSTAKAWLFGTNSRLEDRAPIVMLRETTDIGTMARVFLTARAFAGAAE